MMKLWIQHRRTWTSARKSARWMQRKRLRRSSPRRSSPMRRGLKPKNRRMPRRTSRDKHSRRSLESVRFRRQRPLLRKSIKKD